MRQLHANVWLLTLISALAMSAGAMMVLVGGILGAQMAPQASYATLPVATMIIGTALGVVPITRLMQQLGRKPVFIGVALLACMASLVAAWMVQQGNFWGFLASTFGIGVAVAGFQQMRFAAMESVAVDDRPKAASSVLLGGLAAAFLGPELAIRSNTLTDVNYVGSYLVLAGLCLVCAGLFTRLTPVNHAHNEQAQPHQALGEALKHPKFIIAVASAVVGYALMSFIMTATPVHMHVMEHFSMQHTKWVIQSHILAMFLPSFLSGWLIARLGIYRVLMAGALIYFLTIAMALSGSALLNYWLALVLLGIGWNFLFVGGTVLLPQSHSPSQAFKAQGLNEFCVFSAQAVAALGAGAVLHLIHWQGLLMLSLAILTAYCSVMGWQALRLRRLPSQPAEGA